MKKTLLEGLAVAAAFAASTVSAPTTASATTAPPFKAPTLQNKWVELKEIRGSYATFITFWATWCSACKEELKALEPIFQKYKNRGFTVIAVNTDGPRTQAQVRTEVASRRLTFPIILDKNGDIARLYKVGAWPTGFLLDSLGAVVSTRIGYHPGDERKLEQEILKLIPPEVQSSSE